MLDEGPLWALDSESAILKSQCLLPDEILPVVG